MSEYWHVNLPVLTPHCFIKIQKEKPIRYDRWVEICKIGIIGQKLFPRDTLNTLFLVSTSL